jgi:hypothetical protein
MITLYVVIALLIIVILGLRTDWFTCFHKWVYVGTFGITYQQKKCRKCNKLKIVNQ